MYIDQSEKFLDRSTHHVKCHADLSLLCVHLDAISRRNSKEGYVMRKSTAVVATACLVLTGGSIARAQDYSFPTGMTVTIERGDIPSYNLGSNLVYQIVNYFTVNFPDGDQQFVLKDEAGEALNVIKEENRYFINSNVPVGEKVYFGPNEQNVADPVRVMLEGPINVGHIHFARGSASLSANAKEAIGIVAQEMADHNLTSAYIVGMTDRSGSDSANLALSAKRASATATYLKKKLVGLGVENPRITTEAMGEYLSTKRDGISYAYDRKASIMVYPTV
jgi:outer membrane protein OmpA-like peptidoglycan-associated protein